MTAAPDVPSAAVSCMQRVLVFLGITSFMLISVPFVADRLFLSQPIAGSGTPTQNDAAVAPSCGADPPPLSTTQPNVLLIGDSISMPVPYSPGGYGVPVHQALQSLGINVWHNGGWDEKGQASNTVKGLHCTDPSTPGNWLNVTGTYDVIHFNFGLHDLVAPVRLTELLLLF